MVPARLLDLTRLVSRLGRGPMTGIDRVELAYLAHFLTLEAPLYGLVRSSAGWVLLDRRGCLGLKALAEGAGDLGRADVLGRLTNRKNPQRARADAAVRRLALARALRPFLGRLLRRVPAGSAYFNVGHANLTMTGLQALRGAGLYISVLIHDTIPLDHAEFARPGTVAPFRAKIAAVSALADRVIHITNAARALTEAQMAALGRVPPGITAPIGVALPAPDPAALPQGLDLTPPYFVTLGTIEPRKNHALLLDVWEGMGPEAPVLVIIGGRGWADAALFDRLDKLSGDSRIKVMHGMGDGAVAAVMAGACALLAPSRAEGFGLPPLEAAMLGIDVIATDLLVTRELLGDKAVYLEPSDSYSWMETIRRQAQTAKPALPPADRLRPPTWAAHFNTVLRVGG